MTPKQRREIAIRYLRSIPRDVADEHVDMGVWAIGTPQTATEMLHCGTTACAGGWLCLVPELQADGLARFNYGIPGVPYFGNSVGFEALAGFFDLKLSRVVEIFSPRGGESGSRALKRVCRELKAAPYYASTQA